MIDNIYFRLLRLAPVIKNPVLVTITATEGSTPQKAGDSAIFKTYYRRSFGKDGFHEDESRKGTGCSEKSLME